MTLHEAIETIKIAIAEVEWQYPMDYAIALEMAIKALEGQKGSQWVSVKERLPEEGDLVLIVANGKSGNTITHNDAYEMTICPAGKGGYLEMWPILENAEITHWMPLPEPPQIAENRKEKL